MILAGDIGGTKTVLALCELRGGVPAVVREAQYPCAAYASLEAVLEAFLAAGGAEPPALAAACFGVAGPVTDGVAQITNLPWLIDAAALGAQLEAPVQVINDLQATALGALALPATAFTALQAPATREAPGATIAVIAPGTGLGEAVLVADGGRYRALPSEGGHADFAPQTDEEIDLLRFMRERHGGHVSIERVLSGAGIGDLYDFARGAPARGADAASPPTAPGEDRNAAISRAALGGSDPAAVRALRLFVALLGAEAGNHALRTLAKGGVVIGGGIPPKILPLLERGALVDALCAKGRFSGWLRTLGVRVMLEPRAALLGAAHEAAAAALAPRA
jgi:glucokinase